MRFLSLFSGIESASVAWEPLGWKAVAFSEIEPFPCAVLQHHYPDVPNLGDITKITEKQVKDLGPIDLVVAGFPCTDFSGAGKRKGLTDADTGEKTRSGLFYDAVRVINWAQKNNGAKWMLLENVPGMLNSKRGEDFSAILSELSGLTVSVPEKGWKTSGVCTSNEPDQWSLAWRVLNSQFFGVPQRRRRVFIVGHFGDGGKPVEVLFEPEGVQRHTSPRKKETEDSPVFAPGSIGTYSPGVGTLRSVGGVEASKSNLAIGYETGGGMASETTIASTLDTRCKNGPVQNQTGTLILCKS
jgi:DNA (cytosine-5)-methyltransferase 1